MKIQSTIDYQAAPETVFRMLTDEGFQNRKCRATEARSHEVSIEDRGERTVVTSTRQMSTEGLDMPSFANVGPTLTVKEVQDWGPADADGSRQGTILVQLVGLPLQMQGTLALTGHGETTTETVDADLKCSIPLLGGKIEEMASPAVRSAIDVEQRLGRKWLAEQHA
ncbi:MAG TPA: DUF2505 domain-containing protein [Segeticoccus sp.]|uniref:DUF2505 domain-containing protein n=1 Tax=Segeticoccus sp. TaxID=2706531 RepID=UPI002D80556D|nr:DUF2505 domain-containing protein [Segeticoccus sp.]HET8601657.1 DUF2505 domain-containing protein [Segeticoccus sp.]